MSLPSTWPTSPPPVVVAVTPRTASSAGGDSVVIQGSGFTGATAVTFGFTAALAFTVVNDTTITASTPAYTMKNADNESVTQLIVDVIVTTPTGGSSKTGPGDLFEFVDTSAPDFIDPISPLDNLRALLGERIKPGQQDSDTMFDDDEIAGLYARHNGNMYLAAGEGWQIKAGEFASMVDINESGSERMMSQLFRQANQLSQAYQKAGLDWARSTIERPVGKTASYLRVGLGGPNDSRISPIVADGFDPWFSPTARWWPVVTALVGF